MYWRKITTDKTIHLIDNFYSGGLFKGESDRPGGRFDPNTPFGPLQIKMYTQQRQLEAVQTIKAVGVSSHDPKVIVPLRSL